jgi:hypothetical protein
MHEMFSAARLSYRKYSGDSLDEIIESYSLTGDILAGGDEAATEVIHIETMDIDGHINKRLIAPMARMYVMNEDGQTLDSMFCYWQSATAAGRGKEN